jgi:hypothetical protein
VPKQFSAAGCAAVSRTRPCHPASQPRPPFEPLEGRTLFSVSLDANGFTVVTPEAGSRVVYVSSSLGDDANDGLSPSAPVKSLDQAKSLLRDKSGDQMLLARGDVWHETLGDWTKSGKSSDQPMVIGAYGTGARPRLDTGTANAFSIQAASANVKHLSILGIHLVASARVPGLPDFAPSNGDGGNGLRILSHVDGLLVEDCVVQAYTDNVLLQDYSGPQTNVTLRRNLVVDAYSTDGGHSQGLYAFGVNGLLIEGNLFDHNGWSETVPGAPATIYNHNIYLSSNNANVVVRDNVIANASSHGLQARSGGRVENNVFLDNPIGMTFGVVRSASVTAGGVSGVVNGNVFLGTRDINGAGRGNGLEVGNTRPNIPTVVSNNIFAEAKVEAGKDFAILLSYAGDDSPNGELAAGINDLTVQGNIVYRWSKGLRFDGQLVPGGAGRFGLSRVTVRGNDFQQVVNERLLAHDPPVDGAQEHWSANRYDAHAGSTGEIFLGGKGVTPEKWASQHDPSGSIGRVTYADPDRSADTYAASMGIPSRAALLGEFRASSSQLWRPRFTAAGVIEYVRAGFAEPGAAPRDWRAPTAPIALATPPAPPTAGDAVVTFTVTYGDDKSLDASTFDAGDVRLVGRKGKVDVAASVVSVQGGGDGQPVVVTYAAAAPDGSWDRHDRGKYSLVANERQVYDTEGFFVAAGELASFKLKVAKPPPPDRPPTVSRAKFNAKGSQSLTVWFSEDVGGTVGADDLVLQSEDGSVTVDPSQLSMSYDAAHRAATWTFAAPLAAGRYRATLLSAGITDAARQSLDGNRDRAAGGDFGLTFVVKA